MILEANRMVADWFADTNATAGVNALLPTTPLDAGDSAPANIATFADETRDGNVARMYLPNTLPAVAVSVDHIQDLDGMVVTVTRDGKIKLRVRVGLSNATSADAVRDLSYYLRTVMRSLRKLFEATPALRVRNNIYLESCLDLAEQITWTKDQTDTAIVTGYVLATVQLRDLAP